MNLFHHLILPPPAFWLRLSSRACSGFRIFAIARISGSAARFKKSRTHEVSRPCHRTDKCERNEGRSCFDLEAHPYAQGWFIHKEETSQPPFGIQWPDLTPVGSKWIQLTGLSSDRLLLKV